MSLTDLLGAAAEKFLDTAWGRTAWHVPGADPAAFSALVSLEQLEEILACDATRPPYVRALKGGVLVDPDQYTYSGSVARREVTGLLDQRRLMDEFDAGSTVVLDSINHWIPAMRELCFGLQGELGCSARATAFISPPDQHALELHADSYETFVLQLSGSKDWSLYPRLDPVPRAGALLDEADFAHSAPDTVVLRPGDLLYLPWGMPHSVKPLADGSVHISIAMTFPTWADVLTGLLEPILVDARLNDPVHLVRGTEFDLGAHLRLRVEDLAREISSADCEAIATGLIERATKPTRRQAPRGLMLRDER